MLLRKLRQWVLDLLANGQQFAFERFLIPGARPACDDCLPDDRHLIQHCLAETGDVGRNVAPAEQDLTLDLDEPLQPRDRDFTAFRVLRKEAHRYRIVARLRQCDGIVVRPIAQQFIGNLNQATRAVADQRIGTACAAVIEISQH